MDLKSKKLMDYLSKGILHPDVSGFELLEILDIRSQLASREPLLDENEKDRLENRCPSAITLLIIGLRIKHMKKELCPRITRINTDNGKTFLLLE